MSKDIIDEVNSQPLVLIPEGEYQVVLKHWKKFWHFGRNDLVMLFEIVDQGDYFGKFLHRYYQVKWEGEKIVAGPHSNFFRDYQNCFGRVPNTDQFKISMFEDKIILAEVYTVREDKAKRPLAEVNQYSQIDELLKVIRPFE